MAQALGGSVADGSQGVALPAIGVLKEGAHDLSELPQVRIKKLRKKRNGSLVHSNELSPSFMRKMDNVSQSVDLKQKVPGALSPGPGVWNPKSIDVSATLNAKKSKRKRANKSTIEKNLG